MSFSTCAGIDQLIIVNLKKKAGIAARPFILF
jgi:hypothetical protein